jgi:hypothetical protein
LFLSDHTLYGSARLGQRQQNKIVNQNYVPPGTHNLVGEITQSCRVISEIINLLHLRFKVNNQTNELILLDILEKDKSGFVHEQQERVQLKFEGEYLIVFYFTRTVAKFNGEDKPLSTIAICFETKINTMSRRPVETTLCCFPEQNPYAIERLTTHPLGVLILEKYTYP